MGDLQWAALPAATFAPLAPSADRRDAYVALLSCFHDAALESPTLNLEQLLERLAPHHPELLDADVLANLLDQLCGWGHLEAAHDEHATYRDVADFKLRSSQWFLTDRGGAAVAALQAAARHLAATAGLQPAVIDQIARALAVVADAVQDGDPAQVHVRLSEAASHHESMLANLRTFTSQVQRLLGRSEVTDDDLLAAKGAILDYLQRYVLDAEAPSQRVAAALARLDGIGRAVVVEQAVEGANLAPGLDGTDPAVAAVTDRQRTLDALDAWYRGTDGMPGRFDRLKFQGRDEILRFMRVLDLRREQRRRAASLPQDFRALARAFAAAPDDPSMHRLWATAFGLHPARHHHIEGPDGTTPSMATPAAGNPQAPLTIELRRRPRSTGRPRAARPVTDTRAARAAAAAEQARRLRDALARREVLATDRTVPLSSFGRLDGDAFDELMALLRDALAAPLRDDGVREALSPDGQVQVQLHPPIDPTASAALQGPDGTLRTPDFLVHVELLGRDVLAEPDDEEVAT